MNSISRIVLCARDMPSFTLELLIFKRNIERPLQYTTTTMLQRSTRRLLPALSRQSALTRSYSTVTDNPVPANNPKPQVSENQFTVSGTNKLPSSTTGSMDGALIESPEYGEELRQKQAPNRDSIWSRSQQPRAKAMIGPRFEQTIMQDQVCTLADVTVEIV